MNEILSFYENVIGDDRSRVVCRMVLDDRKSFPEPDGEFLSATRYTTANNEAVKVILEKMSDLEPATPIGVCQMYL